MGRIYRFLLIFLSMLVVMAPGLTPECRAAVFHIEDNTFLDWVGDFYVFSDFEGSGTGLNYEVVKFKPRGNATSSTAWDGSPLDQAPHGDVSIADLWTFMDDEGITSVSTPIFGFDLNESGSPEHVVLEDLEIHFGTQTFSLGDNTIRIDDHTGSGSNESEAFFMLDLGYDFMTTYSASSTEDFYIEATISDASGGFEEFYLSAALTGDPPYIIPEPSTVALLALGFSCLVGFRRRFVKR